MIPAQIGVSAVTNRAAIPITKVTEGGIPDPVDTPGDPILGHIIANNVPAVVVVRNTDMGGPHTVYEQLSPVDGQAVDPKAFPVPPGGAIRFKLGFPGFYGKRVRLDVDSADLRLQGFAL